jgi:hypothetical protein
MVRQIETRLSRLEANVPPPDEFGIGKMTSHELEVMLHDVRKALIAHPETSADERERAQLALNEQEATVRSWLAFYQRPDIADAIARNRAKGFFGYEDRNTIDWEALAEVWGIT